MVNCFSSMNELIDDVARYVCDRMAQKGNETFAQMLLRLIRERELTNAEFYRKAHIDKRSFYHIIGHSYTPRKTMAVACALALELSPEQAETLLNRAGHTLKQNDKFSIITEYCLAKGICDIDTANILLDRNGCPIIGSISR